MTNERYVLAIDQGTTAARVTLFDAESRPLASAQRELLRFFSADSWGERDSEHTWAHMVAICGAALETAGKGGRDLAAIAILPVDRPAVIETTAPGAACLAGFAVGLCPSLDAIAATWRVKRCFEPVIDPDRRPRASAPGARRSLPSARRPRPR
ncbi:MAG: FGGY family carbohydrate kinase [Geminicoccaceae bacterium]|nr:FGGY family carbohydrate kinase [Geminicoccaceae bacterium]